MREPLGEAGPTDRRPPFRFSATARVDVAETDLGAVVYYGRYAHHVDRAVLAHRRHLGIPGLGPPGHLFVIRSYHAEYHASAVFDDVVETFVRIAALGRSSHAVATRMERHDDGALLAEARLVIVGLASYGGRPSRIPEEVRAAVARFEGIPEVAT
jgi:acyl-CoA thioester hydrolase